MIKLNLKCLAVALLVPAVSFACPDLYSNCQRGGSIIGEIFTATQYHGAAPECGIRLTGPELLAECQKEFGSDIDTVVFPKGADWLVAWTTAVYWDSYTTNPNY